MIGSVCDLKCLSKIWGIPNKIGAPKLHIFEVFRRLRNLTANITENTYWKTWCRQSLETTMVPAPSQNHEPWSTNGLKYCWRFYPAFVNFGFCFIAKLRIQRSANKTQPNFAERQGVNRCFKILEFSRKCGTHNMSTFGRFSMTSRLNVKMATGTFYENAV